MTARPDTHALPSSRVLTILTEEEMPPMDAGDFLRHWPACREYRISGGGGMKVWARAEGPPIVNCYRECETPAVREHMARVNARLRSAWEAPR